MRGNSGQVICHYKGKEDDFIVYVESSKAVSDWKADSTIPLVDVVKGFKVFVTHKVCHSIKAEAIMLMSTGTALKALWTVASHSTLENEFGTHNEDEVIKKILTQGSVQDQENSSRNGDKNDSKGTRQAR
ncbi:hypothetical protein MRB53_039821 [Persea americana]|nr:hypothetical protein MRB53_039821 [Persea americana]